ncbi:MFS transporter [Plantactinospora sp. WMMB782]|uniref:MFS transporter n=1 Tax=Plantactinospora sp. WMMB782 TaxID=3404121 RepID=UPI003B95F7BC
MAQPPSRPRLFLALLALSQLITSVDYNIVYVALPAIGNDLGFAATDLQWVVSAYAVAFGGFLLFGGRASDVLGRRRLFVAGLTLYAVSSVAGALAGTAAVLVAARAVQGVGGALLYPATLALVSTGFPAGRQRNQAFGVWAGAGGAGLILGSLLGGVLTETLGWQWVFLVNVPLAAIGLLGAATLIPPDPAIRVRRSFDLPGAVLGTAGVTLLVFSIVQGAEIGWTSPPIVLLATVTVALLAGFVLVERRTRDPLLPPRMLSHRNLTVGLALTTAFMATFGTSLYFLTVYFQEVREYGALRTGLAFGLPVAVMFVGSLSGGWLLTRFGARTVLTAALAVGACGAALLAMTIGTQTSYPALVPGLVLLGAGQGVIYPVMFAAAGAGVAGADQGVASGMVSTGQQVGSALGLAVLVAVANGGSGRLGAQAPVEATTDGVRTAILVIALGVVATLLLPAGLRRPAEISASTASVRPPDDAQSALKG